MMKGASIQVVAWFPAETRGALAHWTLVAIVPEMVAGVAGLMVVGMNIWKGNLCISSGPPQFKSLEGPFFFGHEGGGGG